MRTTPAEEQCHSLVICGDQRHGLRQSKEESCVKPLGTGRPEKRIEGGEKGKKVVREEGGEGAA
jgi:hypothetical protein